MVWGKTPRETSVSFPVVTLKAFPLCVCVTRSTCVLMGRLLSFPSRVELPPLAVPLSWPGTAGLEGGRHQQLGHCCFSARLQIRTTGEPHAQNKRKSPTSRNSGFNWVCGPSSPSSREFRPVGAEAPCQLSLPPLSSCVLRAALSLLPSSPGVGGWLSLWLSTCFGVGRWRVCQK